MSEPIVHKCTCGHTLGVQLDSENFEQRHEGRVTRVSGICVVTITCDDCGRTKLVRLEGAMAGAV